MLARAFSRSIQSNTARARYSITDTTATAGLPERHHRRTSRAMPPKLHLRCRSSHAATTAPLHHHAPKVVQTPETLQAVVARTPDAPNAARPNQGHTPSKSRSRMLWQPPLSPRESVGPTASRPPRCSTAADITCLVPPRYSRRVRRLRRRLLLTEPTSLPSAPVDPCRPRCFRGARCRSGVGTAGSGLQAVGSAPHAAAIAMSNGLQLVTPPPRS
jgi:hypothetical protein